MARLASAALIFILAAFVLWLRWDDDCSRENRETRLSNVEIARKCADLNPRDNRFLLDVLDAEKRTASK